MTTQRYEVTFKVTKPKPKQQRIKAGSKVLCSSCGLWQS